MITETIIHSCHRCHSTNIRKNGWDRRGKKPRQKYHCLDCNTYGTLNPDGHYDEAAKERALAIYQERASIRGTARVMGVHRTALLVRLSLTMWDIEMPQSAKSCVLKFLWTIDIWNPEVISGPLMTKSFPTPIIGVPPKNMAKPITLNALIVHCAKG